MLGSNFALLVKSPGDDGQQLLTTGSSYVHRCTEQSWKDKYDKIRFLILHSRLVLL